MAASVRDFTSGVTAGPTDTPDPLSLDVEAGDLILFGGAYESAARDIDSVADDDTNTYARVGASKVSPNAQGCTLYRAVASQAGTISIQATMNSALASNIRLIAASITEIVDGAILAAAINSVTSGTSLNVGPASPGLADFIAVSLGFSENVNRPLTTPSGYTSIVKIDTNRLGLAFRILSAEADETVNWAVSGGNSAIGGVLGLFETGAAGPAETRRPPAARRFITHYPHLRM